MEVCVRRWRVGKTNQRSQMKKTTVIYLLFILITFSCRNTEKSFLLLGEAQEVYFKEVDNKNSIEDALNLVNEAIKYDNRNISAYHFKTTLLTHKRDINGLLEVNEKLIYLLPEKPYYKAQKALFLEIKGDTKNSKKLFEQSIHEYETLIEESKFEFSICMEFISVLEAYGDTLYANKMLQKMNGINFTSTEKDFLKYYKKESVSKEKLFDYWNGKIEYEELEN
jgi:tetratricopeptide (TPR) repeat protein